MTEDDVGKAGGKKTKRANRMKCLNVVFKMQVK